MSGSWDEPWSDNPNAPKTSSSVHFGEKAGFTGFLIAAILHGIVITLFFQCMGALLSPINHGGSVKWVLVAHTVAIVLFVTIAICMGCNLEFISRIDNREFPGVDGVLPAGSLGYKSFIHSKAISIVPDLTMFPLNQWLADGFLASQLYRCYVIYVKNYWVIVFPSLMYLASLVMGIIHIFQEAKPGLDGLDDYSGTPYFTISLALNILLTLMIVTRLVLHSRNLQSAMGTAAGPGRLYKTIVTILIESCALYTVSCVLFIGPWIANSWLMDTFWPILNETQAIAPLLIIKRVADRSALTSDTLVPGNTSSIRFGSRGESTGGNETLYDGDAMTPVDGGEESPGLPNLRVDATTGNPPS